MIDTISLTPGFSPVVAGQANQNRFNGFFPRRQAVEMAHAPRRFHHPAEAGC
jgi:hypothetical protein